MDFPLWDLPSSGLLIALVAVVHVFISHFAVGGGLFLVLTERLARRESNTELLDYVRRHSRFFILVTLVGGAITGVGIWFTIGLIQPRATSMLIQAFVWGWAIEWTFFVVEIAAAMIYYYGWDRMDARTHQTIGWIYFAAAWLSLAVINGIVTFMLTPGDWITTHNFWDGILNPTYLPGVVARTTGAMALAGLYALATAAWIASPPLKQRIARYAITRWILPAGVVLPLTVLWYLAVANNAGVPVAAILGAPSGALRDFAFSIFGPTTSGYPLAQHAAAVSLVTWTAIVLISIGILLWRPTSYGRPIAVLLMACGLAGIGGLEWLREDLRKPYVISRVMYVNGMLVDDVARVHERGILHSTQWTRRVATAGDDVERRIAVGREVFRLECSSCHTVDGFLAIRPLTTGTNPHLIETVLGKLDMWRHRRMPPFVGSDNDRVALATYLASLGGAPQVGLAGTAPETDSGRHLFEENCAMCHGPSREFPFAARGRTESEIYDLLGRLPQLNDVMSPFEGSEADRRAVASYLATLNAPSTGGGGVQ